jgi:hypothetical protein
VLFALSSCPKSALSRRLDQLKEVLQSRKYFFEPPRRAALTKINATLTRSAIDFQRKFMAFACGLRDAPVRSVSDH